MKTARIQQKTSEGFEEDEVLVYHLLASQKELEEIGTVTVYGIGIELKRGDTVMDAAQVADITSQNDTAQRLFECFVRNTVTPCTLQDVAEDFINGGEEWMARQEIAAPA